MHNLSMTHHVAGREDEAVKLQEEIAKIGEEMGMTPEEREEAGSADEQGLEAAVKLTRQEGGQTGKKKETRRERGGSAGTWKPRRKK